MNAFGISVCLFWILSVTAADSSCVLDLGLVVDTTKSIKEENVLKLKEALKLIATQFTISKDKTRVSLGTFAKTSVIHNFFKDSDYYSKEAVMSLIDTNIGELTKITRLDNALQMAEKEMFNHENGQRLGVRSAMVLFTDGRSHPKTSADMYMSSLMSIKSKGVRVVVVGIGPGTKKKKFRNVLKAIGGTEIFYVDDYDELGDAASGIATLICPSYPCDPGLDLALVVDRTESVGYTNFELIRGFLLQLVDALTISHENTHIGMILFGEYPEVLFSFGDSKYHSGDKVHEVIENMPANLSSKTFIDRALTTTNDLFAEEAGGHRPGYPKMMILLTDGKTNPDSKPFKDVVPELQAKGVKMVAIGVGNYEEFEDELNEIARDNVYTVDDFRELSDLFTGILDETCDSKGDTGPLVTRGRLPELERDWGHGQLRRINSKFYHQGKKNDDYATE